MADNASLINSLYQQHLGRAADPAGYAYWMQQANSGLSGDALINAFTGGINPQDYAWNDSWGSNPSSSGLGGSAPTGTGGGGSTPSVDLSGVNSQLSGLGSSMTSGFNGINTGLNQTNQNIGTLGQNMNSGFTQTNQNLATGLNSLNTANETRATALGTQAGDNFNQLKGWTSGLKDQISGLGTGLNTQLGGLATGQAALQSTADTMNSGLGNLQQDFTRRSNIADQKRGEILDSVAGTAATTQRKMGQGFDQMGRQMTGLGGAVQPQAPQPGQQAGGGQQDSFLRALGTARQAIANPQNLNPAMGAQLSEFVSAFDQQGQLIPQGPDAQGVMTFRQMGPDGLLQIAKQSGQGLQFAGAINIQQIAQMLGGNQ